MWAIKVRLQKPMSEQEAISDLKKRILEKENNISSSTKQLSNKVVEFGRLNKQIQSESKDIQAMLRQLSKIDEENQKKRIEQIPKMSDAVVDIEMHTRRVWERMNALAEASPKALQLSIVPEVPKSSKYNMATTATLSAVNIASVVLFAILH